MNIGGKLYKSIAVTDKEGGLLAFIEDKRIIEHNDVVVDLVKGGASMENEKGLIETVDGMLSEDWKERLVAEYTQSNIRLFKLLDYLMNGVGITEEIREELDEQLEALKLYNQVLEKRCIKHGLI